MDQVNWSTSLALSMFVLSSLNEENFSINFGRIPEQSWYYLFLEFEFRMFVEVQGN